MGWLRSLMATRYRFQLGLIHLAVAMTLVPINGTLNRVMIKELGFSAALVALLASLPYLLSPIQVFIGAYADRHPLLGRRRTPYIVLGLVLCVVGVMSTPRAAFVLREAGLTGWLLAFLAFGAWGMGYNFSTVSYFALAGERSEPGARGRTVAVMMTMMIVGIIATSVGLSRLLEPYTPETLVSAFQWVGWTALGLGLLGLWGLEPRRPLEPPSQEVRRERFREVLRLLMDNSQARRFFLYLLLLLTALLAQDVLLEPFAAEAFGMPVHVTTRITALWGACFLLTLLVGGWLEQRIPKRVLAQSGNVTALVGFLVILGAGFLVHEGWFYVGLLLLGSGTGLSTVSNMSLMFDLTTPGRVGLYMGAWGMANAFSRWFGSISGGLLRDGVTQLAQDPVLGYLVVFALEALLLALAVRMLPGIRVADFQRQAGTEGPSVWERAAWQE